MKRCAALNRRPAQFGIWVLALSCIANADPPPSFELAAPEIHPLDSHDRNRNRMDDELEALYESGWQSPVDFIVEYSRADWEQYFEEIYLDLYNSLPYPEEQIIYTWDVLPGFYVAGTALDYPLWVGGECDDVLICSLLDLVPQVEMMHALHAFGGSGSRSNVSDYLNADRVSPELWIPEELPNLGYNQCSGYESLIAVADTGIDSESPDHFLFAGGYNVVTGQECDPVDVTASTIAHGTSVAYVASGWSLGPTLQEYGVAPLSSFLDICILDPAATDYSVPSANIIEAMSWVFKNRNRTFYASYPNSPPQTGIDALNISFADGGPVAHRFVPGSGDCEGFKASNGKDPVSKVANYLTNTAGIPVVAAAGNCGEEYDGFGELAAAKQVITVGAYDMGDDPLDRNDDTSCSWSNHGPSGLPWEKPNLVAPGHALGLYGTSLSTPQVAGTVALLRQAYADLDFSLIKQGLEDNAYLEGGGHDPHLGWGALDAWATYDWLDNRGLTPACSP